MDDGGILQKAREMSGELKIKGGSLELSFYDPENHYLGTRFDRSGLFRSLRLRSGPGWSDNLTAPWFGEFRAEAHDCVCGPVDEFSAIGYDEAGPGGTFLKIGVGLLRRPEDPWPYDRFRLYEIADPGVRDTVRRPRRIEFYHILSGYYSYVKVIEISGKGEFELSHYIQNTGKERLQGEVYNHNFFTLGNDSVGPARMVMCNFPFEGEWRTKYPYAFQKGKGLHFSRPLLEGESVYMGNIRESGRKSGSPYEFYVDDEKGGYYVAILGDGDASNAVMWANHRIACIEPYIPFDIAPGETFSQVISYSLGRI